MSITVEVDKRSMAAFEHNMKQLIAITKEPVEDILKQQGRLFAQAAAKYTDRFGDKKNIGTKHKEDVEKTIRSIYKPIGGAKNLTGRVKQYYNKGALKMWNAALKRKDASELRALAIQLNLVSATKAKEIDFIEWDGGAAHTRRLKGKSSGKLYYVFGPAKQINQYIKKKKAEVGAAKYGWAKAAKMLGHKGSGRGFPAWFAKGHRTRGFGRVRGTGSKAELTVAHYGKYGFSKTSMSGLFRHRTNMMAKQIERMIKAGNREAAKAKRMAFRRTKLITR